MRRLYRNLIYLGVITAVELGVFGHYNHLLRVAAQSTNAVTAMAQNKTAEEKPATLSGIQPLNSNLMAVSDDGEQFAYVDASNKLIAMDAKTGKILYSLQLQMKPVYLGWIRNDSLFIGTEVPNGNLQNLRLSTITLSTGALRLIHEFDGYATDATFRDVAFSPYTNDVYIVISSSSASVMFHYDTNGNLNPVDLAGHYVTSAQMTSTSDIVYLQDRTTDTASGKAAKVPNVLRLDKGAISVVHTDAVLLRVIGETMYYGTLDVDGDVTAVYKVADPLSATGSSGSGGNAAGTAAGSSGSGSGGSASPSPKLVLSLKSPVPPAQMFVTNADHIVAVTADGIEDLSTGNMMDSITDDQTVVESNSLLLLSPDGTLSIF